MQYLLDTHTFIWFIQGDNQLSSVAKQLITDLNNDIFLSSVSLWEIAIKTSLNKINLYKPFSALFPNQLVINDINLMPIDYDALNYLVNLPYYHRDPFDRLIISQAITKNIPIITTDSMFANYPVQQIW